jgi:hypothetical protein
VVGWPSGRPFHRVYRLRRGFAEFNPGLGDTRFAPLIYEAPVPTLYGGEDETVALLESVFHDVSLAADRIIYQATLRERGLAHLAARRDLRLIDLSDEALGELGLSRSQLVTSGPDHYACTRQWSRWLHEQRPEGEAPDGLVWHSRQAELTGRDSRSVMILFGDRAPTDAGSYRLVGPGVRNLVEGVGAVLVEEIAETLDALIEPG